MVMVLEQTSSLTAQRTHRRRQYGGEQNTGNHLGLFSQSWLIAIAALVDTKHPASQVNGNSVMSHGLEAGHEGSIHATEFGTPLVEGGAYHARGIAHEQGNRPRPG